MRRLAGDAKLVYYTIINYINNNTSSRGSEEERIGISCCYEIYICIGKGKIMCDGMMPKIINKYHTRGKGSSREYEKCLSPLVGRNLQVGWAGQVNKSVRLVRSTSWLVGQLVGQLGVPLTVAHHLLSL